MNIKKMWSVIVLWWAKFASRWKTAEEVPALPTLPEFEVLAIEPDAAVPSFPIEIEFIEPEVVEPPISNVAALLMSVLLARHGHASSHYQRTGSCNVNWPAPDCRVSAPQDSRILTMKRRNSRSPR